MSRPIIGGGADTPGNIRTVSSNGENLFDFLLVFPLKEQFQKSGLL